MVKIDGGGALGVCLILGLLVSGLRGHAVLDLGWILCVFVGLPAFCALVLNKSSISTVGKWALVATFLVVVTGIFLLW